MPKPVVTANDTVVEGWTVIAVNPETDTLCNLRDFSKESPLGRWLDAVAGNDEQDGGFLCFTDYAYADEQVTGLGLWDTDDQDGLESVAIMHVQATDIRRSEPMRFIAGRIFITEVSAILTVFDWASAIFRDQMRLYNKD